MSGAERSPGTESSERETSSHHQSLETDLLFNDQKAGDIIDGTVCLWSASDCGTNEKESRGLFACWTRWLMACEPVVQDLPVMHRQSQCYASVKCE